MTLEVELATYRAKLHILKPHEGKFVLIQGEEVAGTFDTWGDAVRVGYEKFKFDPFMVKQIQTFDQLLFVGGEAEQQLSTLADRLV